MSDELLHFFLNKRIATSRTTAYNPAGNGQVEKYNGTIWKVVTMAFKTRGLPMACWQDVFPDALHSLHSLLCTAINCSPHERLLKYVRRSSVGDLCLPGSLHLDQCCSSVMFILAKMLPWWTKLSFVGQPTLRSHPVCRWPRDDCVNMPPGASSRGHYQDVLPAPDVQEDSCITHGDEPFHEDIGDVQAPDILISDAVDEPL